MARRVPEVEQEQRRGNAEWQILASQEIRELPEIWEALLFLVIKIFPRAGRNQRFTRVIGTWSCLSGFFPRVALRFLSRPPSAFPFPLGRLRLLALYQNCRRSPGFP
jgi:hypothetical protein